MAMQTSSNPTLHSMFLDLLNLLDKIPLPSCRFDVLNQSSSAATNAAESVTVGDAGTDTAANYAAAPAPVACLRCYGCEAVKRISTLRRDVLYIHDSLVKLSSFEDRLGKFIQHLGDQIQRVNVPPDPVFTFFDESSIRKLSKAVTQLKFQLPSSAYYNFDSDDGELMFYHQQTDPPITGVDSASISERNLLDDYNKLNDMERQCLWCFSVFPENEEIKKRVLIYWWIGEGFLDPPPEPNREQMKLAKVGEEVFEVLKQKQFIQPVMKKGRVTNSCRMEPSVRSFVISQARVKEFFDFDQDGKLTGNMASTGRAPLLKSMQGSFFQKLRLSPSYSQMVKEVKTLYNVDVPRINIDGDIFADMKCLRVLYLGRSNMVVPRELIQLNNIKFMEGLKRMKDLKLISLQGITSIRELPDLIGQLRSLVILDLRGCQALESLPLKNRGLSSLTHLDVSACHTLLEMPKGISSLSNLQVLKGFVVGNPIPRRSSKSCTLHDLLMLKKLERLSISVLRKNFPEPYDFRDLANMKVLIKLKIVWRTTSEQGHQQATAHQEESKRVLEKLEKLDLWCMPPGAAASFLTPSNFPRLKKLYIRGSKLQNLHHNVPAEDKWNVETLRLMFLPNLEIKWEEVNLLFPNMSYLEKRDCPRLDFPSCNEEGVWKK